MMIAGAILVALAGLLSWQRQREMLMQACHDRGQTWNGRESRCEPTRMGPILRRALERS